MDLVHIRHGIVLLADSGDLADGRNVAVHRVQAFEHDELGAVVAGSDQDFLEMGNVIVAEDHLLAARAAHALDHGIVVQRVRHDQAIGQQLGNGRNAGEIRNPARGEGKRIVLAVQIREFGFKLHQRMVGA